MTSRPLPSSLTATGTAYFEKVIDESLTALEWTEQERHNIVANVKRHGQPDWVADMLAAPLLGGAR